MSTIGLRVRLERDRVGITLEDLAERCGISPAHQQDIENDKLSPEADYLGLAAQAGLDVVFILTGQRQQPTAAEQQLLADYRAGLEKGRSAVETKGAAGAQQPVAPAAARKLPAWAAVAVAVILVLALIGLLGGKDDVQPGEAGPTQAAPQAPPPTAAPKPPYETTAAQLHRDYEANEVAADAKIDGRPVLVRGAVQSIDKDFLDAPVLSLATSNQFMPVRLSLRKEQASVAGQLKRGQQVAVYCVSTRRIIGTVMGSDCDVRER